MRQAATRFASASSAAVAAAPAPSTTSSPRLKACARRDGDLFKDRLESSLQNLTKHGAKVA
jgi:hypothetical protein